MSGSMMMNSPHSAAPGGGFNVSRYSSQYDGFYEEAEDEMGDMPAHQQYNQGGVHWPRTASIDGGGNRFNNQQSKMNVNSPPFVPGYGAAPQSNQNQALHDMQMLQMEVMRLQAVQAQQYQANAQAQYLAELARQQAAQSGQNRRASVGYNVPASAGPTNSSFDLRAAAMSAQARRANQADMLKAQLGIDVGDAQVPMTAALGGKFGARSVSSNQSLNGFSGEQMMPSTPAYTTVISGGTPLGGSPLPVGMSNNNVNVATSTPSKSDSAVSWRRNGNNNSVLSGNRSFTLPGSPTVKITPPPQERVSPPPGLSTTKARPLPLRFSISTSPPMSAVSIDASSDGAEAVEVELPSSSSCSSRSDSLSPTTPPSSHDVPLSPREEASKKLYEGLGVGRPIPSIITFPTPPVTSHRMASQPMRQPRGPPSGADELGPKNFATRIRRKAIGGLGVLMGARERRVSMIEEC